MIGIKVLREAHERIALRLLNQQSNTGRGLYGHAFWGNAQSEAWALPTTELQGTQDDTGNSLFVLGASPLGGEPLG